MVDDSKDSLTHHADRSAQMREEYKEHVRQRALDDAQRSLQQAEQREQSLQAEEKQINDLVAPGTTRDQLLDRIRQMREEKVEVKHDYYVSPGQQEQLDLEQATGRAAVAKAEAEAQRIRDARMLAERTAQGEMVPVHHPNPSMDEQYPAIKSTLGKPSGAPKQLK